jgi:hypothetical protein
MRLRLLVAGSNPLITIQTAHAYSRRESKPEPRGMDRESKYLVCKRHGVFSSQRRKQPMADKMVRLEAEAWWLVNVGEGKA